MRVLLLSCVKFVARVSGISYLASKKRKKKRNEREREREKTTCVGKKSPRNFFKVVVRHSKD